MPFEEKKVTYTTQNTYATLNQFNKKIKYVWLVFHGIGYLSRYFLKHFNQLHPEEHYIIAPQAPSKYYLKNEYKYVGASWLTKENTIQETKNVLAYLNKVFEAEKIPADTHLVLFGFSQGVSIALRWMAKNKIQCNTLALYAGSIPNELATRDFEYLDHSKIRIKSIYGNRDEFLNEERLVKEKEKLDKLFQGKYELISFEGGHEIMPEIIAKLV